MKTKIYTLLLFLSLTPFLTSTESFVIKKKKRKISSSTLKQNCCDSVVHVLECSPDIVSVMADIQKEGMKKLSLMLEGDFAETNKSQLQETKTKLRQCEQLLADVQQNLNQVQQLLRS